MLRRHLLALGGVTVTGATVNQLGELLTTLDVPAAAPLPARIEAVHVEQVQELTRRLGEASRRCGSNPILSGMAAERATQLLVAPGSEQIKRALMVAAAQSHISAGWAAFDGALPARTMYHYSRALELATRADDTYLQSFALACAGLASVEHGHPDDGLKMLQLSQVKAWDLPRDDDRGKAVRAWGMADSATALAMIDRPDDAYRQLAQSRSLWQPKRTDTVGDLDIVAARLELQRHHRRHQAQLRPCPPTPSTTRGLTRRPAWH